MRLSDSCVYLLCEFSTSGKPIYICSSDSCDTYMSSFLKTSEIYRDYPNYFSMMHLDGITAHLISVLNSANTIVLMSDNDIDRLLNFAELHPREITQTRGELRARMRSILGNFPDAIYDPEVLYKAYTSVKNTTYSKTTKVCDCMKLLDNGPSDTIGVDILYKYFKLKYPYIKDLKYPAGEIDRGIFRSKCPLLGADYFDTSQPLVHDGYCYEQYAYCRVDDQRFLIPCFGMYAQPLSLAYGVDEILYFVQRAHASGIYFNIKLYTGLAKSAGCAMCSKYMDINDWVSFSYKFHKLMEYTSIKSNLIELSYRSTPPKELYEILEGIWYICNTDQPTDTDLMDLLKSSGFIDV